MGLGWVACMGIAALMAGTIAPRMHQMMMRYVSDTFEQIPSLSAMMGPSPAASSLAYQPNAVLPTLHVSPETAAALYRAAASGS